jgi:hypothetical protein
MSIECVARRDISVTMLAIRELHINTPLPAELRLSPRAELLASGLPIRHIEIASDSDMRFLMKSTLSCQVARIALSDPPLRTMEHTRLFWTDVDWQSAAARDATFSNKLTAVYEKLNSE